jgi:hypothetical protein
VKLAAIASVSGPASVRVCEEVRMRGAAMLEAMRLVPVDGAKKERADVREGDRALGVVRSDRLSAERAEPERGGGIRTARTGSPFGLRHAPAW